jgi:hypothetical protein
MKFKAGPALSALQRGGDPRGVKAPSRASFEEFLLRDARVPSGRGLHGSYSFAGREALLAVVRVIDRILGNNQGNDGQGNEKEKSNSLDHHSPDQSGPLCDAELCLAGGAQFGKTILELNLAAYITAQNFRNFGLYLPDDDLVEGIVDSKFRPDVVDQIDWFAEMVQVGKALNKSGKAVNRKGAFLVTDGQRKSVGMIRGLGKVPTTFSMDAAALDEVDDIQPKMMKFVRGRLTASDLRFILKLGTQRVHGRGMNRAWKAGSQGVFTFACPKCGRLHCAEEEFPAIVRLRSADIPVRESPAAADRNVRAPIRAPNLTWAGDFRFHGSDEIAAVHDPTNKYYLGCVACGAELDRRAPMEQHRQPMLLKQRKWSFRISQLAIGAIDLSQIVGRFQAAIADPEEMIVFRCDVLGLPQSTSQALTPAVLDRARSVEIFDLAPRVGEGNTAFGGLDMGDRCWLFARENAGQSVWAGRAAGETGRRDEPRHTRLLAADRISAGDVVTQACARFEQLGLSALFVDERPLVNEARTIALAINGLQGLSAWPRVTNDKDAYVTLPGGLTWDGRNSRWLNLKCAVVRFTKNRLGAGIEQTIVFFEEGGQTKFVPCIACNRFETIDRAVREFLTPAEGVVEAVPEPGGSSSSFSSQVRATPAMLLPRMTPGHPPILDAVEEHLIAGSEREKEADGALGDYVDGCENHLLLADAYSALAAVVCRPAQIQYARPPILYEDTRRSQIVMESWNRSLLG